MTAVPQHCDRDSQCLKLRLPLHATMTPLPLRCDCDTGTSEWKGTGGVLFIRNQFTVGVPFLSCRVDATCLRRCSGWPLRFPFLQAAPAKCPLVQPYTHGVLLLAVKADFLL